MESKLHFTPKQWASILFIFATLVLLSGLFLSAVQPVVAQTGTTGTATAVVPVTGATANRHVLDTSTLKGWTVVDRSGTQIGTVDSLLLDLRNASVCAASSTGTSGSVSATSSAAVPVTGAGTPTAMVGATSAVGGSVSSTSTPTTSGAVPNTGGTMLGWQNCTVSNASQTSGVVSYVVVDRSGFAAAGGSSVSSTAVATSAPAVSSTAVATSSAAMSSTPVATAAAAVGAATPMVQSTSMVSVSGNLVPVPWRFVRLNVDQHTVIVDTNAAAFNNAPGFTSGNVPDVTAAPWTTNVASFWNNTTNLGSGAIPNTGGNAQQATAVATSTTVATVAPTATTAVVATTEPTATGVVATTEPTATSVVATTEPTATSAAGGVSSTPVGTATSAVVSTVSAPGVSGTPTALVPVTGVDLAQVQEAAAAQQRMILDIGIVGVGLVLLALGIIIKTGKS